MQVIIDEVVSNVRALSGESVLAPETMRRIVEAVLEAVRAERDHADRVAEEGSLRNYQQRNQPWRS